MPPTSRSDSEELLQRAIAGDAVARERLLVRYRDRLKRMIAVRMDHRLARRVDPSDIVQETLSGASLRLEEYFRLRPLPFYPWLRQRALEEVARHYRRHVRAAARSVTREEFDRLALPDHSAAELAANLLAREGEPADRLLREEQQLQVRRVLCQLSEADRELLLLRFLERLSARESAQALGITLDALKWRQRRALERFTRLYDAADRAAAKGAVNRRSRSNDQDTD